MRSLALLCSYSYLCDDVILSARAVPWFLQLHAKLVIPAQSIEAKRLLFNPWSDHTHTQTHNGEDQELIVRGTIQAQD